MIKQLRKFVRIINFDLIANHKFIIYNFTFELNIFIHTQFMQDKQKPPQNSQRVHIENLKTIYFVLQQKQFYLFALKQMKEAFILFYVQKISAEVIWRLGTVREALKQALTFTKLTDQLLADMHLCLAFASETTNHRENEQDCRSALAYEKNTQIINLAFSIFLYSKKRFKEGIRHLNKLKVPTAFEQEEHRKYIWYILLKKINEKICLQILKSQGNSEQLEKVKFISQILKFKECFLYRCTQIQQLSQLSYSQLAVMLWHSNRFEDSLTLIYKLRNISQKITQDTQYNLAILFFRFNKWQEGVECAQQVIRINPRNQKIYIFLILALIQLKKYSQAKDFALKLLNFNKYDAYAYQHLGLVFLAQGREQMAVELSKLGVVIQQSETTYAILAFSLFANKKVVDAERWYIKSIRNTPLNWTYARLGQLYWQADAYLNAIRCFFQAIRLFCTELTSFYLLGLCVKNSQLKSIINHFIVQIKEKNEQNLVIQTNIAVFYFISKQSQSQFFDFMSKFLEQRKKGEQTVYSDVANNLISGYGIIYYNHKYLDVIFAAMIGYLARLNQQYFLTHKIYVVLMHKYKIDKNVSICGAFTTMYQTYISKTPKELQAVVLQFIIAEMVQQSTEQAIKCYFKSLSYAEGDYNQFHSQLYKQLQKDLQFIPQIDLILQNNSDGQSFTENKGQIPNPKLLLSLKKCLTSINSTKKEIKRMRNFQNPEQAERMANVIRSQQLFKDSIGSLSGEFGLSWRAEQLKDEYLKTDQQIKKEEQTFKKNLHHLAKLYKKGSQNKQLLRKSVFLVQPYFNLFVLNQKIKVVFNYFYPYVLSARCHKQFAFTLWKLKNSPEYNFQSLREDMHNIFKQANRDQKKEWEPKKISDAGSVVSSVSVVPSVIEYPLIDVISQTRSQMNEVDRQFQSFIFYDPDQIKSKVGRKNSQSSISSFDEEDYRQLMRGISNEGQSTIKIINALSKNVEQQSEEKSQSSQSDLQIYYESDIQSNQSDEIKWYQSHYSPNNTKFSNSRLYAKFNQFLHLNTYFLIKYLSKQSTIKHIAKHKCNKTQLNANQSFTAKVEHGDQMYHSQQVRGGLQERTLKWIQLMGPRHIFRWIIDIALGVKELEDLGIYHADLFFRNTIRVTKGDRFSFKIIDFDKAFKINKTQKKDKTFQCTENLFDFWLRFKFDGDPRQPMYQLKIQSVSSKITNTTYNERDILEYIIGQGQSIIEQLLAIKHQSIFSVERLPKCLELLNKHMKVSHLEQYSALVLKLLLPSSEQQQEFVRDFINHQKIYEIIDELERLEYGKISYVDFADKVKNISGLQEQDEEIEQ